MRDRTRAEKEKARNRKEVERDNFYAFLFNQNTLITSAIVITLFFMSNSSPTLRQLEQVVQHKD